MFPGPPSGFSMAGICQTSCTVAMCPALPHWFLHGPHFGFSMADVVEICCVHKCKYPHGSNVPCSNTSVSACLERALVQIASFSLSGMCHGQNRQFQIVWTECAVLKIANYQFQHGQKSRFQIG
jgi:hypothetical protein